MNDGARVLGRHPILDDPHWLLAGIEAGARRLHFVETTRDHLRAASFLDGRTPLSSTGRTSIVEMTDAVVWLEHATPAAAPRWIVHSAFCGSTLLTRLLESSAECLVYREPVVLNEISSLRPPMGRGEEAEVWSALLRIAIAQLQKRFDVAEPAVVKLSNWPLDLAPDVCLSTPDARAIFVSMAPGPFLTAVLEGGPERLKYMLAFSTHLARHFSQVQALNQEVDTAPLSTTQRALRRCLVALDAQQKLFASVRARMPLAQALYVTRDELIETPDVSVSRACSTLGLSARAAATRESIGGIMSRHAKSPDRRFDAREAARTRDAASGRFGAEIAKVLEWGAARLEK